MSEEDVPDHARPEADSLSFYRKQVHRLIGARLQARRKQLGWSQRELSEKLSVSRERVAQYETGRVGVDSGDLPQLAFVLTVPLTWFFADIMLDENVYMTPDEKPYLAPREDTLRNVFRRLGYRDQTTILDLAFSLDRRTEESDVVPDFSSKVSGSDGPTDGPDEAVVPAAPPKSQAET